MQEWTYIAAWMPLPVAEKIAQIIEDQCPVLCRVQVCNTGNSGFYDVYATSLGPSRQPVHRACTLARNLIDQWCRDPHCPEYPLLMEPPF